MIFCHINLSLIRKNAQNCFVNFMQDWKALSLTKISQLKCASDSLTVSFQEILLICSTTNENKKMKVNNI